MISTTDEKGIINNFAKDPESYPAEYPTAAEQRRYWVLGSIAALFMAGVFAIAFAVS